MTNIVEEDKEIVRILFIPIGRFALVETGRHKGRIGFRTESAFFIVDEPEIDFLNTASIYASVLPESFKITLPIRSEELRELINDSCKDNRSIG